MPSSGDYFDREREREPVNTAISCHTAVCRAGDVQNVQNVLHPAEVRQSEQADHRSSVKIQLNTILVLADHLETTCTKACDHISHHNLHMFIQTPHNSL